MMHMVWILWALKIAGLTMLSYSFLIQFSVCVFVVAVALECVRKKCAAAEYNKIIANLDKEVETNEDDDFQTYMGVITGLILRKLYIK